MNRFLKLSALPFVVSFNDSGEYLVGQRHQNNGIKAARMIFLKLITRMKCSFNH